MKCARILIVSGSALSRNPRVLKEAETLSAAGHQVTVLTLRNHAAAEIFDSEILASARFGRIVVDVAPILGSSRFRVFLRRLKIAGVRRAARHFGWESIETIGPARELLAIARRQPADLVIGHTEIGLWVAERLLAEGRKVGADIEDWHSQDLPPTDRIGRPVRLLKRIERTLLRKAAFTFTVSAAMADALQADSAGNRPAIVGNSFPLQPHPRRGPPSNPPAFLWFSQTLGPGRGLEDFLAAWQHVRTPSRLVLLGEARRGYSEALRSLLPSDRRPLLEFRDLVSPGALPAFIAQHDLGLALETTSSRNRDLTITNKLLQYLNAGLAVVATPTAGQREVLGRAPEAGVLLGSDPRANAVALDQILGDRKRLESKQRAARQLAETHYSWTYDREVLLKHVCHAILA